MLVSRNLSGGNTMHIKMPSNLLLALLRGRAAFFQGILGTRFGSLELKIGSLKWKKIIIGYQELEKIGSLESEKSGPYRSISGT